MRQNVGKINGGVELWNAANGTEIWRRRVWVKWVENLHWKRHDIFKMNRAHGKLLRQRNRRIERGKKRTDKTIFNQVGFSLVIRFGWFGLGFFACAGGSFQPHLQNDDWQSDIKWKWEDELNEELMGGLWKFTSMSSCGRGSGSDDDDKIAVHKTQCWRYRVNWVWKRHLAYHVRPRLTHKQTHTHTRHSSGI